MKKNPLSSKVVGKRLEKSLTQEAEIICFAQYIIQVLCKMLDSVQAVQLVVALILTHLQVENCLAVGCHRCLSLFATLLGTANVSTTDVRLAFTAATNYLENLNHYYLGKSLKIMYQLFSFNNSQVSCVSGYSHAGMGECMFVSYYQLCENILQLYWEVSLSIPKFQIWFC